MALFDWFRKPKPTVPLPQLCYDVAYFVLPHYAFNDLAKLADLCLNAATAAGPFFYAMAAQMRKAEPDVEDAKRFRWHHGQLEEGWEHFTLEYPTPPPVDMSDVSVEHLLAGGPKFVLAPYFSGILRGAGGVQYFILGQAPMGGGTTLRCILPEGSNCNLGPGPEPTLASFLDAVRERVTKRTEANGGA
ncbi:MAG: hypothetical protein ACRDD1_20275 [Planctomycetia bacterium]